jgi:Spy/CpxP family protein refolding chaperone
MNEKRGIFAAAVLLLAGVAAVSSLVTVWVLSSQSRAVPPDYHAWIHEELAMTEEQERRLEPSERRYEETKRHLTEVIRLANQELGVAISEDRTNSPRVQAAVERIHAAMGELQQATLRHIFEMQEVLEPEQYEHLIKLTQEALESQGKDK